MRNDEESNRNLLALDAEKQFEYIIDTAIDHNVDFIVHSGDMFDKINVKHTDLLGAMRVIDKLKEVDIPFIVIGGNHDKPATLGVTSPLKILKYQKNYYSILDKATKSLSINGENVNIHGIGYLRTGLEDVFKPYVKSLLEKKNEGYNILTSHQFVVNSNPGFEVSDSNEPQIPIPDIPRSLNYVAMGHIHKRQTQNHPLNKELKIHYPGSPIVIDFNERAEKKGISIVDITSKSSEIKTIDVPLRKYVEVDFEVNDPTTTEIEQMIEELIVKYADPEAFVGFRLKGGMQLTLRKYTMHHNYRKYFKKFAGFHIYQDSKGFKWYDQDGVTIEGIENWIMDPIKELESALDDRSGLSEEKKKRLMTLGEEIIEQFKVNENGS